MIDVDYIKESIECGIDIETNLKRIESKLSATFTQVRSAIEHADFTLAASICHQLEGDLVTVGAVCSASRLKSLRNTLRESPSCENALAIVDEIYGSIDNSIITIKHHIKSFIFE